MSTSVSRSVVVGGVLLLAIVIAVVAAERIMGAPRQDLEQLALFLSVSGVASLLLGAAAVTWANHRLGSLRTRLTIAFGAGLVVAIANVVTTSALMFLNPHDLSLLFLLLVFATVISLTFSFTVTSLLTSQIEALAGMAGRIAGGDLSARANLRGSDEVARLGESFDHMAQQLEDSFARQKQLETTRREMVVAISHDLRTPLATTRAMVEALNDRVVTEPAEVQRYLTLIGRETLHLSRLIDDLFELSQIESGAIQLTLARIDPRALVSETVAAYEAAAVDQGLVLWCRVPPGVPPISADGARLQRVLRNLVDNALRHTPPGGEVLVEAGAAGSNVEFRVVDSGPGVPVQERERIFERFYRGERSRHRGEQTSERPVGAGLGLAIARGLVEAHAGRIWIEPGPLSGAAFCFTVPTAH